MLWMQNGSRAFLVQSGLGRVKSNLASSVKKGKMTKEAADAVAARVKGALDYSDFKSVDMVGGNMNRGT